MIPLIALLWSLLLTPAMAEDCDISALKTEFREASPQATARLYPEIAACSAATARKLAPEAFDRILSGEQGTEAAIAAVEVGARDVVREWIAEQRSDERARTLADLGEACSGNPAMVSFFGDSHKALQDQFWRERWHRGLSECREPGIQALLRDAIQDPEIQADPSRFGGILEVFSRNLGSNAIPWLKALALSVDEEMQLHVVSAFADASGVGSVEGMNQEAAEAAVKAIVEIAPKLPDKSVEQARITLQALGDTEAANALAAVRYAERAQDDGRFLWGVVAVEDATCKRDRVQIAVHYAPVYEPGHRWPDQMQEALDQAIKTHWTLDLAERCKGTSTKETMIPSEPFADMDAYTAWRDEIVKDVMKREARKHHEEEHEPIVLP